jgi:hypothetical protein
MDFGIKRSGKMKGKKIANIVLIVIVFLANVSFAQRGYYDAPYVRYEADLGTLANGAVATSKSYKQSNLQSEASEQVCVDMTTVNSSVEWTVTSAGKGLVVRYSIPDGETAVLKVYANSTVVGTLNLSTYYSWEDLKNNGNPNNVGVSNANFRMRFDEVRLKLAANIPVGGLLKLETVSGNIHLDFAELEAVPIATPSIAGDIVYSGDGSDLQVFIDANNGKALYIPPGVYNVNRELYFGVDNTSFRGAGMWYTEIHFTNTAGWGGLKSDASNVSFRDLYLTTVRNSRSNSYKAINGVYTSTSVIKRIWAEHFECGAWIAQYNSNGPAYADGFNVSQCRFRNNYADGINLCKGTSNAVVEHCSFRNNGDDDMAIWSSNGLECIGNTYRYNTSENCWRSAGCAIYGGKNNKAYGLIIRDNLEAGIKVNNSFSGIGFNTTGTHEFYDIDVIRCGTFNDLFNRPVGAIDIACNNIAGTRINNVKFSNIAITDSKNDAIYIHKASGEGFYNLAFENIAINGTGKEWPDNDVDNLGWGRGYGFLFVGYPSGNGTYCNVTYANLGGQYYATTNTSQIGSFSFTSDGCGVTPVINVFDNSETDFSFYPNPVNNAGNLKINAVALKYATLNVKTLSGTVMLTEQLDGRDLYTIGENLPKGMYILEVVGVTEAQAIKFIKL